MGEQVLIFGARGYIGRVISRLMSESQDFEPVRIFRSEGVYVTEVEGDVSEFANLEDLALYLRDNSNATGAINAAAMTVKSDSYLAIQDLVDANVRLPAQIAKVCVTAGIERLVHFGTFSTSMDGVSPSPQTFYAASKSAGYEALRYFATSGELQVVIIEPFDIYAADHPHGKIISTLVESLASGRRLQLSKGEQELAPIHALDVSTAAIKAITMQISVQYSEWSLPGPEILTLKQLATDIAKALGTESNLKLLSFTSPYRSNEIFRVAPRFEVFPLNELIPLREGIHISALP